MAVHQVSLNKVSCVADCDHTGFADVVRTAMPFRLGATELRAGKRVPIDDNYLFASDRLILTTMMQCIPNILRLHLISIHTQLY